MSRIYTRTGDYGETGLIGGKRVSKDSPSIQAVGSLDELNALIGLARSHPLPARVDKVLQLAQNDLFAIGADVASPDGAKRSSRQIGDKAVRALEQEIDFFEESLQPLKRFILPGGSPAGATLHLVRAVARRTERCCVALSGIKGLNPSILCYLNRLSDLCFVVARYVNHRRSTPEMHPSSGRGRNENS